MQLFSRFRKPRFEAGGVLEIEAFDLGEDEFVTEPAWIRQLVGAILCQAMHDGMTRVRMGVDSESGEPYMDYFGPVENPEYRPQWWHMFAAPAKYYPHMLQACLVSANLRLGLPMCGKIAATKSGQPVEIAFEMDSLEGFELSWSEAYAQAGGVAAIVKLPRRG